MAPIAAVAAEFLHNRLYSRIARLFYQQLPVLQQDAIQLTHQWTGCQPLFNQLLGFLFTSQLQQHQRSVMLYLTGVISQALHLLEKVQCRLILPAGISQLA